MQAHRADPWQARSKVTGQGDKPARPAAKSYGPRHTPGAPRPRYGRRPGQSAAVAVAGRQGMALRLAGPRGSYSAGGCWPGPAWLCPLGARSVGTGQLAPLRRLSESLRALAEEGKAARLGEGATLPVERRQAAPKGYRQHERTRNAQSTQHPHPAARNGNGSHRLPARRC